MEKTLNVAGVSIPKLGIGTYTLLEDVCREVVSTSLQNGYRHIDTAQMYGNEVAVGDGLRLSGIAREEVFVTTKVWYEDLADGALQRAAEASLKRLGLSAVDLYLIHWTNPRIPLRETIGALNAVKAAGLTRAIGISNFPPRLAREAAALSDAPLAVDQVEYHPYLDQSALLDTLRGLGMGLTAYCPLARGAIVSEAVVTAIAARRDVAPSAVALAFLIGQDGVIAIPSSRRPERLAEALGAYDIVLSDEERAAIAALANPSGRIIDLHFAPDWAAA